MSTLHLAVDRLAAPDVAGACDAFLQYVGASVDDASKMVRAHRMISVFETAWVLRLEEEAHGAPDRVQRAIRRARACVRVGHMDDVVAIEYAMQMFEGARRSYEHALALHARALARTGLLTATADDCAADSADVPRVAAPPRLCT